MNKITLLKIALLCSLFSFAQNIDTTKYQKVAPGDTVRNYYDQNNNNNNNQNNQQQDPNQQPKNYQPNKSYPYRNQGSRNPNNNPPQKKQQASSQSPFVDKLYYGAYIYFTGYAIPGASVIYYELSPHVGYKITNEFSAGLQILYNNSVLSGGGQSASYSVFGGGPFARYLFPKINVINAQFFAQAEYDILAVPSDYLGNVTIKRTASEEKMAGLGIRRSYNKFSMYFMFMYDFSPSYFSPYYDNPLVYRLGFSYNW
jgi:hypothetical protein